MTDYRDQKHPIEIDFHRFCSQVQFPLKPEDFIALESMLLQDPEFLEPLNFLAEYSEQEGQMSKAYDYIEESCNKAYEIILEDNRFPKTLKWEYPENCHLIRAISAKGLWRWKQKEYSSATNIFEELLNLDCSDPLYLRYYLMGCLEKMPFKEFEQTFLQDGSYSQDVKLWFQKHLTKHMDCFRNWLDANGH
jgi:tetratricopeptide (TPR) repeat protein